jgi:Uma2 family endonuclease
MAAPIYYTAEIVRALLEDGNRSEVVHGELLVTPVPGVWHQEVTLRLTIRLSAYLNVERVGHPVMSRADISWGPDTLVQPDVFVVPLGQARTLDWAKMTDLLLVAEVLSHPLAGPTVSPNGSRACRSTGSWIRTSSRWRSGPLTTRCRK